MKKILIAAVIVLGLALVASIYYCVTISQDNDALSTELQSTQDILTTTQAELGSTKQTLTSTLEELGLTQDTLTSTQSELGTTKDKLASTQLEINATNQTLASTLVELNSTNRKLTFAQDSLTTVQDTLSSTRTKLTAAQETLDGLGITVSASYECFDVDLIDNPEAKNPTLSELKTFLSTDKTENNKYIYGEYDCSQFSRDVHNNAEAAGIRAAEVNVFFKNEETGHALNAFLTTDYGLVYVDCTEVPDKIAYLKTGKTFKAVQANWVTGTNVRNDSWWDSQISYSYIQTSTGGQSITQDIKIYW